MDWKYFFIGVGFLAVGYWFYRGIKGKSLIDEDNSPRIEFINDWGGLSSAFLAV
jgi:hypothetical protein